MSAAMHLRNQPCATTARASNETGKVKLNIAVTYTPTDGDPSTQSVKVKLTKR